MGQHRRMKQYTDEELQQIHQRNQARYFESRKLWHHLSAKCVKKNDPKPLLGFLDTQGVGEGKMFGR